MLKAFAPGDIPRLDTVAIDLPTALFTSAGLVLVTLLVGLAPALVALRMNAAEGRIPNGRSSDSRTRGAPSRHAHRHGNRARRIAARLRRADAAQPRMRCINVDLGFATESRFAFKTNLTERSYPDAARVDCFYEQLTARLESLPGTIPSAQSRICRSSGEGHTVSAAPAEVGWRR